MGNGTNLNTAITEARSFTLLETIVAIYVLLTGVVGAMILVQQNVGAGAVFRNQLIGANLAQEGIELIKARRDSNYLAKVLDPACIFPACDGNTENFTGIEGVCDVPNRGCKVTNLVGSGVPQFDACNGLRGSAPCQKLLLDPTTGLYNYNTGNETMFDRRILVRRESVSGAGQQAARDQMVVESIVTWESKFGNNEVIERTILTPWLLDL